MKTNSTKKKSLTPAQLKHLRSRISDARHAIYGDDDEKNIPKNILAAKKLVAAFDKRQAKIWNNRRKRINEAIKQVEQVLLFDPDNALKAVQDFEKMKP